MFFGFSCYKCSLSRRSLWNALYNTNHHHFHKKLLLEKLSRCRPIHATISCSVNVHFNIILPITIWFLLRLSSAVLTRHIFGTCLPTLWDSPMVICTSSEVWNLLYIYLSILVDVCASIFFRTHLSIISSVLALHFTQYSLCFSLFDIQNVVGTLAVSTCNSLMCRNKMFDIGFIFLNFLQEKL
jgi:hypothetical protein